MGLRSHLVPLAGNDRPERFVHQRPEGSRHLSPPHGNAQLHGHLVGVAKLEILPPGENGRVPARGHVPHTAGMGVPFDDIHSRRQGGIVDGCRHLADAATRDILHRA